MNKIGLNLFDEVSKAYVEGVYADTPANRKLGRVGMTYAAYAEKVKEGGNQDKVTYENLTEEQFSKILNKLGYKKEDIKGDTFTEKKNNFFKDKTKEDIKEIIEEGLKEDSIYKNSYLKKQDLPKRRYGYSRGGDKAWYSLGVSQGIQLSGRKENGKVIEYSIGDIVLENNEENKKIFDSFKRGEIDSFIYKKDNKQYEANRVETSFNGTKYFEMQKKLREGKTWDKQEDFFKEGSDEKKLWDSWYKYQKSGDPSHISTMRGIFEKKFPGVASWKQTAPNTGKATLTAMDSDGKEIATLDLSGDKIKLSTLQTFMDKCHKGKVDSVSSKNKSIIEKSEVLKKVSSKDLDAIIDFGELDIDKKLGDKEKKEKIAEVYIKSASLEDFGDSVEAQANALDEILEDALNESKFNNAITTDEILAKSEVLGKAEGKRLDAIIKYANEVWGKDTSKLKTDKDKRNFIAMNYIESAELSGSAEEIADSLDEIVEDALADYVPEKKNLDLSKTNFNEVMNQITNNENWSISDKKGKNKEDKVEELTINDKTYYRIGDKYFTSEDALKKNRGVHITRMIDNVSNYLDSIIPTTPYSEGVRKRVSITKFAFYNKPARNVRKEYVERAIEDGTNFDVFDNNGFELNLMDRTGNDGKDFLYDMKDKSIAEIITDLNGGNWGK